MKSCKLTLLFLACSAALPALAADAMPRCGAANFDTSERLYTVIKPLQGQVMQQCLLTVYQRGTLPDQARTEPNSYLEEGRYQIEFAGGGGGGAGGGSQVGRGGIGGGGGAGSAPWKAFEYLRPGSYTLTLGTGGQGGKAYGGRTGDGNPTSFIHTDTGVLIVGIPDADTHLRQYQKAKGTGHGANASTGGSTGGDGGNSGPVAREPAESGGDSQNDGYAGDAGNPGKERARIPQAKPGKTPQSIAGGGGGASYGKGGDGDSVGVNSVAGVGVLGGGGGGGSGGGASNTADPGARGGHGYIRLTLSPAAP